jgi:uncharacterized repeat protein (TIGR03943 family)
LSSLLSSAATRWLGVGLASCLAVVTIVLALTDRLALYISPSSNWFAISMAVLVLVGAVASFALPLGAEDDHGHDHGTHSTADDEAHTHARSRVGLAASVAGGVVASGVIAAMVLVPPASLSAEIAATRDVGAAPLFGGTELVTLATQGDTSSFGVGDWASVFATATNPDAFEGTEVTLTGFIAPGDDGTFDLTRLVITHCVIDAQVASLPIAASTKAPADGQWVTVTGTVRSAPDGTLQVAAAEVTPIDEPKDPYEY